MSNYFIPKKIREELLEEIAILQEYPSFIDFLDEPNEDSFYDFQRDLRDSTFDNLFFYCGATKGVIVVEECDYVIKFPFLSSNRVDYCMIEAENYAAAVREGLSECFAITELLEIVNGFPIYAQKRADCDEDSISTSMSEAAYSDYLDDNNLEDDEETKDAFYNEYWDWNGDDRSLSITYRVWEPKIARTFWDFCRNRLINDLHEANWGYVDGNLVAVDYSGYGTRVEDAWLERQVEEE